MSELDLDWPSLTLWLEFILTFWLNLVCLEQVRCLDFNLVDVLVVASSFVRILTPLPWQSPKSLGETNSGAASLRLVSLRQLLRVV